jgi:hypothetical protein
VAASVSLGLSVGEALGASVGEAVAVAVALATVLGMAALTSRLPASSDTRTMISARAIKATSRRLRPLRGGLTDETMGRGISGPVGAKGGRGPTVPVIALATQVRQLRREVLQQSLQTNWRHSWQKRKLWTKDW